VLVVDDHAGFRASMRDLLASAGWCVVAEAADSLGAVAAARALAPDVIVVDIGLRPDDPGGDGIDLAHLLAELPVLSVVVLVSGRPAESFGQRLTDAPVRGFIPKHILTCELIAELVARG
jgi:DNA-binding NarL/FixJ family response regulator